MSEQQIIFGAISPRLVDQLKGRKIPDSEIVKIQKLADAVTLLRVQGIITDSATHGARKKIMRRITKAINDFAPSAPSTTHEG